MGWGEKLLGSALSFRYWRRRMGELLFLAGGLGRVCFGKGIEFDLCISMHIIDMVASFPFSCGSRLALYPLDQGVDVVRGAINFLPIECVSVGSSASIAPSTTDEGFAKVFR